MKKIMKKCLALLFSRHESGSREPEMVPEVKTDIESAKKVLVEKGYTVLSRSESEQNRMKIVSSVLKSYAADRAFFTWSMKRRVLDAAAKILGEYEYIRAADECCEVSRILREISEKEYHERHGSEGK